MNTQIYLQQLNKWQDILAGLRQENSMLKIKLSELVDNSVMTDFLLKAEALNNELIINDETIEVLSGSVGHLQGNLHVPGNIESKNSGTKLSSLASDIEKFRKRFNSLKSRFQKDFMIT